MFDCVEFLHFARACSSVRAGEAADRSAISRAYYAAYHKAHQFRQDPSRPFSRTGDAHKQVVTSLKQYDEDLGEDLESLWSMRRRADYELNYSGARLADEVQSVLDTAGSLIAKIEQAA